MGRNGKFYDKVGRETGHIKDGKVYKGSGMFVSHEYTVKGNDIYDKEGKYCGRVDNDGNIFNNEGLYGHRVGSVSPKGDIWKKDEGYIGKVEVPKDSNKSSGVSVGVPLPDGDGGMVGLGIIGLILLLVFMGDWSALTDTLDRTYRVAIYDMHSDEFLIFMLPVIICSIIGFIMLVKSKDNNHMDYFTSLLTLFSVVEIVILLVCSIFDGVFEGGLFIGILEFLIAGGMLLICVYGRIAVVPIVVLVLLHIIFKSYE